MRGGIALLLLLSGCAAPTEIRGRQIIRESELLYVNAPGSTRYWVFDSQGKTIYAPSGSLDRLLERTACVPDAQAYLQRSQRQSRTGQALFLGGGIATVVGAVGSLVATVSQNDPELSAVNIPFIALFAAGATTALVGARISEKADVLIIDGVNAYNDRSFDDPACAATSTASAATPRRRSARSAADSRQ